MKVLFICRQNIGRSQMAMAAYNKYIGKEAAESRGTMVETEGVTLGDFGAKNTMQVLKEEEAIDAGQFVSNQLQPADLDNYDVAIVMSEPENTPSWLEQHPKAERWTIADTKTSDLETTRKVFRDIKRRVLERFL